MEKVAKVHFTIWPSIHIIPLIPSVHDHRLLGHLFGSSLFFKMRSLVSFSICGSISSYISAIHSCKYFFFPFSILVFFAYNPVMNEAIGTAIAGFLRSLLAIPV